MARKTVQYDFDLIHTATGIDSPQVFSLEGIDEITIDSSSPTGLPWVTSTGSLEVAGDPTRGWKSPATGAVSITSATITGPVSVTAYRFGRIRVSAGAASEFRAHYTVYGEGS